MTKILNEILGMSVPERILLVEAIWDSIAVESENVQLDTEQKNEINARIDSYKRNPENVLSWDQIKASLPR
jgi:putative addiction module component (TIGR02574 family)